MILSVTLPFFALIFFGFLAARRAWVPIAAVPAFNGFLFYFAVPAMLFRFAANTPFREITNAYKSAFVDACYQVKDHDGKTGKVKFTSRTDYHPFRIKDDAPVVRRALAGARRAGLTPATRTTRGGLDANWLVRHGVPTVTFGAGQHNIHTIDEYVDLAEFYQGCTMAIALATYTG